MRTPVAWSVLLAAFACLLGEACAASSAQVSAEPSLDDVSPPLSFCFGSHCVLPDLNLSTVNYDLVAKKWDAGVTTIGLGYALLFWSDRPWAPGLALHGSGKWGQAGSHLDLTSTLVLARHLHAGTTARVEDGGVRWYLTLGAGASLDLLSGRTMRERLADAKMARMLREAGP